MLSIHAGAAVETGSASNSALPPQQTLRTAKESYHMLVQMSWENTLYSLYSLLQFLQWSVRLRHCECNLAGADLIISAPCRNSFIALASIPSMRTTSICRYTPCMGIVISRPPSTALHAVLITTSLLDDCISHTFRLTGDDYTPRSSSPESF